MQLGEHNSQLGLPPCLQCLPFRPQPCNTIPANKAAWHSASTIYFPLYLWSLVYSGANPSCIPFDFAAHFLPLKWYCFTVSMIAQLWIWTFEPRRQRHSLFDGEAWREGSWLGVNSFTIRTIKLPERLVRLNKQGYINLSPLQTLTV